MRKQKNNVKGITLVALVVTIIVMLILAGISINMITGDNSILQKAQDAKKYNDQGTAKEQVQLTVLGTMNTNGSINKERFKSGIEDIGGTVTGEDFPLTVALNGFTFEVDGEGNVTKVGPSITVDESSLKFTKTDGSSITKGQVEQGTALKITFNASVEGGTVTVDPSLPHTTTTEEISAKEVTFNITASVPGETVEPITYKVSLKDVYKSNVVGMEELKANANKYFGYDVINYAQTLPANLQDTKWQLFYAGKLDDTDTTEQDRIYIIIKDYAKNTVLPAKNGAKPISDKGKNAHFSTYKRNVADINDGVCQSSIYTGASAVATSMQKYNRDYFNDYTSTNPNMRAVAYMLDTTTWSPFATSTKNYAEWAIGGPTIELLFTAYNKYAGTSYEADALSAIGYKVRKTSSDSFSNSISSAIQNDTDIIDNPYSISKERIGGNGYWIASPCNVSDAYLFGADLNGNGGIEYSMYGATNYFAFRPIVLLNSDFQLEKTTSGGKEAFQIVPKEE